MDGYIKLHRKLLENPVVTKDAEHMAIWIYLLLKATHKETKAIVGGKEITLQPGQLITGRNRIASDLNINSSKVQRVLELFEKCENIEQQMNNQNRVITIRKWVDYQNTEQQLNNNRTANEQQVNSKRTANEQQLNNQNQEIVTNNWVDYQDGEQQTNNDRTINEQQMNTNNNNKNTRNIYIEKKSIEKKRFEKPTTEEIRTYCQERNNSVDPDRFYDFYESKNWYVGKNKMKDWKACVRTWEQRNKEDKLPSWFDKELKKEERTEDDERQLQELIRGNKR